MNMSTNHSGKAETDTILLNLGANYQEAAAEGPDQQTITAEQEIMSGSVFKKESCS